MSKNLPINVPSVQMNVGDKWIRDRYEVHARVYFDNSWADWRIFSRNAKTLEQAREQIKENKKEYRNLSSLADMGKAQYKIVHVVGAAEVIE